MVDAARAAAARRGAIWRHSSAPIEPPAPVTMHDLAVEVGADALELDAHRLAAEHVLDPQLAHLAHHVRRRLQQLEHRRQGAHGDAAVAAGAHHAGAQGAGGRRDGDDDLVGLDLVEDARQVVAGRAAEHRHAVLEAQPALARVVVEEADRPEAERRVAQDLAQDRLAAVAGADDQHVDGRRVPGGSRAAAARGRRARGSGRRRRTAA